MKSPKLATIFNSMLVCSSGWAMYAVTPSSPYAFTACTFACCHGLLGLIHSLTNPGDTAAGVNSTGGNDVAEQNTVKEISQSFLELVPCPMVNIQLSLRHGHSNGSVALSHALFVVPLFFDLITKLFTETGRDNSTETLKDLTLVGDVVSLSLLGLQESNSLYLAMATMAFLSKYGGKALKIFADIHKEECCSLFFNSMFFILTGLALEGGAK